MVNFLCRYYVYIIAAVIVIFIIYLRFYQNKLPNFKKNYQLQIIEYSIIFMSIILFSLENNDLKNILSDTNKLSELTTISGTLAGFIFTGISILYSFISNKVIAEQFKYDFIDHVLNKLYLSIISSVSVIILYVIFLVFPNLFCIQTLKLYILVYLMSLVYFVWSIFELYRFMKKIKNVI